MIASVLAITCSSSATSTLGFEALVVESAILNVPKFEGQSSVINVTFTGIGFSVLPTQ
jgi:hypothetical protein